MNTPARARLIKLVHVGRRELALDEDTYRALIADIAGGDGRTSCTQLKDKELQQLIDRMKGTGFKVIGGKAKPHSRQLADDEQSKKIRSLWLQLHDIGQVRDASEAALASFVKKQTGVEALQWLSALQASAVIERLKKWMERVEVKNPGDIA